MVSIEGYQTGKNQLRTLKIGTFKFHFRVNCTMFELVSSYSISSHCSLLNDLTRQFSVKTDKDQRVYFTAANCLSRKTKINVNGSHGEVAFRFRFLDKSKQRKPVKASEKADGRTSGWREGGRGKAGRGGERGKRERGSVSWADEGSVTLTCSAKLGSSRRGGESRRVHYQCFLRYSLKAITAR